MGHHHHHHHHHRSPRLASLILCIIALVLASSSIVDSKVVGRVFKLEDCDLRKELEASGGTLTGFIYAGRLIQRVVPISTDTYEFFFDDSVMALTADGETDHTVFDEEPALMQPFEVIPNDPYFNQQYHYRTITRMTHAWGQTTGSQNIVVAVIDEGRPQVDFSDMPVPLTGYDFISDPAIAADGNGRDSDERTSGGLHGLNVASVVVAKFNNGQGLAGGAPGVSYMYLRALGVGGGSSSDIAAAIYWAAGGTVPGVPNNKNPARVINLSLGGEQFCSQVYQDAIDFATNRGAVVVVSAGNSNKDTCGFQPASCRNVITVAATDSWGMKSSFSNFGCAVTVAAPGSGIAVHSFQNGFQETVKFVDGTSFSAPITSAAVALLLSKRPELTPAQVRTSILNSQAPLAFFSNVGGAGNLDVATLLGLPHFGFKVSNTPCVCTSSKPPTTGCVSSLSKVLLEDGVTTVSASAVTPQTKLACRLPGSKNTTSCTVLFNERHTVQSILEVVLQEDGDDDQGQGQGQGLETGSSSNNTNTTTTAGRTRLSATSSHFVVRSDGTLTPLGTLRLGDKLMAASGVATTAVEMRKIVAATSVVHITIYPPEAAMIVDGIAVSQFALSAEIKSTLDIPLAMELVRQYNQLSLLSPPLSNDMESLSSSSRVSAANTVLNAAQRCQTLGLTTTQCHHMVKQMSEEQMAEEFATVRSQYAVEQVSAASDDGQANPVSSELESCVRSVSSANNAARSSDLVACVVVSALASIGSPGDSTSDSTSGGGKKLIMPLAVGGGVVALVTFFAVGIIIRRRRAKVQASAA